MTNVFERVPNYYETDQMGIIHHSNYIRWFEEARIDFMERSGIPFSAVEGSGILILVLGVECEYVKPARFGRPVRIHVRLGEFARTHGVRFEVCYRVVDRETGELLVRGATRHCFTDKDLHILRLKRDHPGVYDGFCRMEQWSREQDEFR